MEYYTPAMLAFWLGDAVAAFHQGSQSQNYSGGIRLMDGTEESLSSECLYLGEPQTITDAISKRKFPKEGVFIIASKKNDTDSSSPALLSDQRPIPGEISLIETRLPLLPLYNKVQEHVHRYLDWDARLREVIYSNTGLQKMLDCASEMIPATILLVNPGYKNIAAVYLPEIEEPAAAELKENGYLSFDCIQTIRRQKTITEGDDPAFVEYISDAGGNFTIVHLIRYQKNLAARLCVILNGPAPSPCYAGLTAVLARYVAEYMFSHLGADYGSNSEFGTLAADLIECRLTDPEELNHRLKQIRLAVRRYYHVMLVSFSEDLERTSIPWNYVISQLEYIFPFSNITTYQGVILMIIRKTKKTSRLPIDRSRLLPLLEHYHGFAAIGNASEFLTSLPPVYYQTRETLRLALVMNPEQRIFYYEDYSMYHMVELAAESAHQKMGSRNLVHLCNNAMIALVLYDKKKNTNLVEIAYTYLAHERSTSETAKALFIHRNTMLNKIAKIEEIIGESLDNPLLRERMMFSYHVLTYMQAYRKEDILTLKRTSQEEKTDKKS